MVCVVSRDGDNISRILLKISGERTKTAQDLLQKMQVPQDPQGLSVQKVQGKARCPG